MNEEAHRQSAIAIAQSGAPLSQGDLPTFRSAYSDRTAALMAYLAAFAYHPIVGPKQGTDKKSVDVRTEIPPTELAQAGFTTFETYSSDLDDAYAFIAEGPNLSVLSFRGTQSKQNWNTNFQAKLIHPENTEQKLRVHSGFYSAFEKLALNGIKKKVTEIISSNGGPPLYITGHSLGGALAQIAAAVFSSDRIAACYTFGSPRVGNGDFDLWVKPPSYRLINHADLVPQVPVYLPVAYPYQHSGDPRYLPAQSDGSVFRYQPNFVVRAGQLSQGILAFFKHFSILGIDDHAIANYCGKLNAIDDARTQGR